MGGEDLYVECVPEKKVCNGWLLDQKGGMSGQVKGEENRECAKNLLLKLSKKAE